MAKPQQEVYFVFMNFDPVYERLRADRSKQGSATLDAYLSQKHDKLLAKLLQPDTYWKKSSLAIVDGFAVEITDAQAYMNDSAIYILMQASVLRSAKEVRVVEKNQELA
ncbi:hypothetical protein D1007_41895 [Hordeum vulgare]|uniref:uncharacterized protein LOC123439650 isoform X1 n=1 Tax=Hordeum vulgare subsp. vulgare TaxID=112509 RepID=UPI001D1A5234|nr:uncharacterized protein LOC123439650 isoform X1 [Hordeum vulgare subsp. vulgare]KAE8784462.1 hypothetical protein D1007_41895 [Hordeum vulgare]